MKRFEIISLILAGGEGVRLWPLSTPENPKPFIKLIGGKSFLRLAYERALKISPRKKIFISTLARLAKRVLQELPEFPAQNLILEPMAKNTAPAIAYAAKKLQRSWQDSVMAVFPADHYIDDKNKFKRVILRAAKKAKEGDFLLTFGVKPEFASKEYGYIEADALKGSKGIYKVKRFTEKPDVRKARSFIRKGNYFWNSGMFVWRIDAILRAIQRFFPEVIKRPFSKIQPVSIDYAVMEKADNCYMVELEAGWKDFGSWLAIHEFFKNNKKSIFSKEIKNLIKKYH